MALDSHYDRIWVWFWFVDVLEEGEGRVDVSKDCGYCGRAIRFLVTGRCNILACFVSCYYVLMVSRSASASAAVAYLVRS